MATCPHLFSANLSPPKLSDAVYREDCTLCFDSIDDPAGLDVCMHCYNGACAGERIHSHLHAHQFSHPIALNIQRTRKRKQRDEDGQPPEKMTKLSIKAETLEDRYDTKTEVHCLECGAGDLTQDGKVGEVVDAVLKANTFAREAEVQAWEQEIVTCKHTRELVQLDASGYSTDMSQCKECDLKENLWLCMTCGNIGCGRKVFMGMGPPGNDHQVNHNKATGHPVAVKLGSLTADGRADVHCYACDEEVQDPDLVKHLAHWNIDIAGRTKTEKSMTEMQLDHNLTYDFSMTTTDGKELKALFGPGLTGLKNLGNSCYLASILQSLFSMPEFASRYYRPDEQLPILPKPAEDLETQLRKLADGLLSGRYSIPDPDLATTEQEQTWQRGLAPAMLKHLIGKGHSEFSTMQQQDSFELLLHLLKLITRSQSAARGQYSDVTDPVDAFRFAMEQKLQCLSCRKVRFSTEEMENLSVAVPIKKLPTQSSADGTEEVKEEFEPVTLTQCLDLYTAPETVELTCSSCGAGRFSKQSKFKSFPTILAVNARRFELVNWVPTKRDVPVIVGNDVLDFEAYRSSGLQAEEVELPQDSPSNVGKKAFIPNSEAMGLLMGMGFPAVRCEKALHATGNGDVEAAAGWLFAHMEDPDIDDPVDLSVAGAGAGGAGGVSGAGIDESKIADLGNMGFAAPQARQALQETGGDMERAVDWLFNHPDATGIPEDCAAGSDAAGAAGDGAAADDSTTAAKAKVVVEDSRPARFALSSIVCHKGSSIHAGHYVAFVKKPLPDTADVEGNGEGGEWVLFNDEKVALGGEAEEMGRFAYIYFFRRV